MISVVSVGGALVGSDIGNGRHHDESRSTPHVEVDFSFPSQTRGWSALWLLRHVLGLGQDFQILLSAQMVGELLAPMCSRWGSNLATEPWTEAFCCGFLGNYSLSLINANNVRFSVTKLAVKRNRSSFDAFIIALRRPTTFVHLYSRLNCGEAMAHEISIVFHDWTNACRWIEMHQLLFTITQQISICIKLYLHAPNFFFKIYLATQTWNSFS